VAQQTETLKLVFILYFSILKQETASPLLPAALQGVARFSHRVNIDFFRDLLSVLRTIMLREDRPIDQEIESDQEFSSFQESVRLQLQCIVVAFELLLGQGEK
jgi:nucleolar complex protein 3